MAPSPRPRVARGKARKKAGPSGSAPVGFEAEPCPYWQVVLIGIVLAILGAIGSLLAAAGDHAGTGPAPAVWPWLALPPILLIGAAAARHPRVRSLIGMVLSDPAGGEIAFAKGQRIFWPAAGVAAVLAALLLLEAAHPYYFVQNDNLAQNLPSMLWGCRNLFAGIFPTWNPYQYSGSPAASVGWYALTYPPTWASYWFVRTVLRNENAMLDVFSLGHLLAGYVAVYWVIRRERCRPAIASLAAGCCILSGFALIFSRSWFQFSPVLLWTALLAAGVQELLRRDPGWRWILGFGAVIGLYFHAGHVQMWTYSLMLIDFALLLLIFTGACSARKVPAVLAAHFVGVAIASPLLVPQALATYGSVRQPESNGIWVGLKGLFLPDWVVASPHPLGWDPAYPIGEMYYSGTLFMVLAALLLFSLLVMRWRKGTLSAHVWFATALPALVLALGNRGVLWSAMMYLPGFDRFRYPFKFLGYVTLFASIGGAVALERLLRGKPRLARFEGALVIVVWGLLAYHCSRCTASFYNYGFTPFPRPDPQIAARLAPSGDRYYPKVLSFQPVGGKYVRVFSEHPICSRDPHLVDSYMNQWPTLQQTFSLDGYDGLVSKSPAVQRLAQSFVARWQQTAAEHGVKYILQYDPPERNYPRARMEWPGSTLVYQSDTVFLNELPGARPMAFAAGAPDAPLPVKLDGGGATLDLSETPRGGPVVLNLLWREEIKARAIGAPHGVPNTPGLGASGRNGASLPVAADSWGRIVVDVPPGTPQLRIVFRPPWELGFLAGGACLLAGLLLALYSARLCSME